MGDLGRMDQREHIFMARLRCLCKGMCEFGVFKVVWRSVGER